MSKTNNKDTRTMPLTSFWCLNHHLRPYPTPHANAPISDPEKANVQWAIKVSRENTPKVKPTEVCQENPINIHRCAINEKQQASNGFKSLFSLLKTIIFRSIPNKRKGSEYTSVLLEDLKIYFHKVEFSVLLKNRKCIKITANFHSAENSHNT